MVEINGYDISLTSGDSLSLRVDLGGRDLPEGTDAVFTVKKTVRSRSVVLQKRFNASKEVLDLALTPAETNLAPGMYVWDVRLQIPLESGGYEVYTPMEYAAFAVLETVGDEIGVEGDPGMNPDLPVLQVVLAQARDAVAQAEEAAAKAIATAANTPNIGSNGHWYIGARDTGVSAAGPQGQTGKTPDIRIGMVSTLAPGSSATASITGTPENPVLNLGIPQGPQGQAGSGGTGSGEDGGYYSPSVTENGMLMWTPSKATMPAVSSVSMLEPLKSYVDEAILGGAW